MKDILDKAVKKLFVQKIVMDEVFVMTLLIWLKKMTRSISELRFCNFRQYQDVYAKAMHLEPLANSGV